MKIRTALQEEVRAGKISIGHQVNPKTYVKYIIRDGEITAGEFTVEGRKHKLFEIREKRFVKHNQYMRLHSDKYFETIPIDEVKQQLNVLDELNDYMTETEMRNTLIHFERSRNIQIWHDASTIANHSHLLFSVNILYDKAVFYTDKEYHQKFKKQVNIQSIVETPELYIIGRCKSSDEQLGYIETREECLHEMSKILIHENISIKDTMRIFHGDGPAVQLESGNQKGGHYFCPACEVHLFQTDDISHRYQLNHQSLQDKRDKVLCCVITQLIFESLQRLLQSLIRAYRLTFVS